MKRITLGIFLFFFISLNHAFSEDIVQVEKKPSLNEKINKFFAEKTDAVAGVLFYEVKVKFSGLDLDEFEVKSFTNLIELIKSNPALFKFDPETSSLIENFSFFNPPSQQLIDAVIKDMNCSQDLLSRNKYEMMSFLSKPLAFERAQVISLPVKENFRKEIRNYKEKISSELNSYLKKKFNLGDSSDEKIKKKLESIQIALFVSDNYSKLSDQTIKELRDYSDESKVSDVLKSKIVEQLNLDILGDSKFGNLPDGDEYKDLKSFIKDNQLENLRDFLEAKGLVIPHKQGVPLIVLVLALGGIVFTFVYKFIGWKGLKHSIDVIRGKFDNEEDSGEVTHFQALSASLSATVGLGNIAGVAVAVCAGGPGAVFWMWVTATFGMASKFSSCMLAQVYREVDPASGKVRGGPMYYLDKGISDLYPSISWLGKIFAVIFSVFCIAGSFGGGNLYQGNQTYQMFSSTFQMEGPFYEWLIGILMATGAGLVIIGGIKKIGKFTSRLVPFMVVFYVGTCLFIIIQNIGNIGGVFVNIFEEAFSVKSIVWGGFISVFVNGVKRAAFSNEAGLGSAAIAHAAAKTDEPVREGIVAMIGPFIDTIIICSITALTILVTKAHLSGAEPGVQVTSVAFATVHWAFPYMLAVAILCFSFSTVISWSYYGERCSEYLFGEKAVPIYRVVYVCIVAIGPVLSIQAIIDFSDMMLLSMAFPNIIGSILLAKKGRALFNDYWSRYKSGEMKPDR